MRRRPNSSRFQRREIVLGEDRWETDRARMPPPPVVCPGCQANAQHARPHADAQAGRKRQSSWKTRRRSEPTPFSCQAEQLWAASASASLSSTPRHTAGLGRKDATIRGPPVHPGPDRGQSSRGGEWEGLEPKTASCFGWLHPCLRLLYSKLTPPKGSGTSSCLNGRDEVPSKQDYGNGVPGRRRCRLHLGFSLTEGDGLDLASATCRSILQPLGFCWQQLMWRMLWGARHTLQTFNRFRSWTCVPPSSLYSFLCFNLQCWLMKW